MVAAVCHGIICLCPNLLSSDVATSRSNVALIAPLYVSNEHFFSTLTLTNKTDSIIGASVIFDSLEGEEIARRSIALAPRSSLSIRLDSISMSRHRFPALGSISVFSTRAPVEALSGRVTITSRTEGRKVQVEEDLQPVNPYPGPLHVGLVPASFSVPLLAIHSLGELSQRISVICFDRTDKSFESQLLLPPHMTLLLNACIRGRSESRSYEQLLRGDTGPMGGGMTVKVTTTDPKGAISVWGFAAASNGEDSGPQLVGIEFAELEFEFP